MYRSVAVAGRNSVSGIQGGVRIGYFLLLISNLLPLQSILFKLDKPHFFIYFTHRALGAAAGFHCSTAQDFFQVVFVRT